MLRGDLMLDQYGVYVPQNVNVAVVGAGPAGLGMARVLQDLAIPDVWVLERGTIGQNFLRWPSETRLLTPSFPGNVFGVTDLNAISYDSSPGWALKCEHPRGVDYARYLDQAAVAFGLNVQCELDVLRLESEEDKFALYTNRGVIRANHVIWACGQFDAPSDGGLAGAEHARHYASVQRWRDVPGEEVFVIGGYESGIDAAINLARAGKQVTVFDVQTPWEDNDKDPSRALSPFTQQRLRAALRGGAITLEGGAEIISIEKESEGVRLYGSNGRSWFSPDAPILATGFATGTALVSEWFEYGDDGLPLLTLNDESTTTPGLFLVGPEVSHNGFLFCFIYKFRQRFAVVARTIAQRAGADVSPLQIYYENNMYLDDLTCCEDDKCLC
ncbi:MAG: NAD(P)/FAD-dependent oxidoreductase [Pseudomonadota bacterium]